MSRVIEHLFGERMAVRTPPENHDSIKVQADRPDRDSSNPKTRVIDKCDQVTKGIWWMPWHREAKKDVIADETLGLAGK